MIKCDIFLQFMYLIIFNHPHRCQAFPLLLRTWSCATSRQRLTGGQIPLITTVSVSVVVPLWTRRCARRTWVDWHGCTWKLSRKDSTTTWRYREHRSYEDFTTYSSWLFNLSEPSCYYTFQVEHSPLTKAHLHWSACLCVRSGGTVKWMMFWISGCCGSWLVVVQIIKIPTFTLFQPSLSITNELFNPF